MMNYRVVEGTNYTVIETATEQIIKTFKTLKEAKSYMRSLNLGSGFDGWTPRFMLKKVADMPKKAVKVV
jgi:hypothetical protein